MFAQLSSLLQQSLFSATPAMHGLFVQPATVPFIKSSSAKSTLPVISTANSDKIGKHSADLVCPVPFMSMAEPKDADRPGAVMRTG